ncbi:MAG TPA: hypothetical protein VMX74_01785 [Pirellulales bacterium]|nr:hypothetical protein [Pirellulales bacterium]
MADTARSLAALQVLLADNVTNDISPQDIRDFLVSVHGRYGGIHCTGYAGEGQSINAAGYTKLTQWAGNNPSSGIVPDYEAGTLTMSITGVYMMEFTLSYGCSNNNVNTELYVFKDGVATNIAIKRRTGTAADTGAVAAAGLIEATAGEVFDIRAKTAVQTTTMTVSHGSWIARLIG